MERKELTCIGCPLGCSLIVEIDEAGNMKVSGNSCKIGEDYAIKECTNPTRIVTTTIPVNAGLYPRVSVKTERDIPKNKVFECLYLLSDLVLTAPIHIGDIVYENVLDTGVNIIATRTVEKI